MTHDERPSAEADQENRVLLADAPIEAVWLRLRQLTSVRLAEMMLADRARRGGYSFDPPVARTKAQGLAYAIRNAADYFRVGSPNVSQRVLNLYYGAMAFAQAEMLAHPNGPRALSEVERSTKLGHGLNTISGEPDDIDALIIYPLDEGFFASWMHAIGESTDTFFPRKKSKPSTPADVERTGVTHTTVEQLFARIPELLDLYLDVFASPPASISASFDMSSKENTERFNPYMARKKDVAPPTSSLIVMVDPTARLSVDALGALRGPISDVKDVSAEPDPWRTLGRKFRARVAHEPGQHWFNVVPAYTSPLFGQTDFRLLFPLFGSITEYRAIAMVLLYALSIVVRYRPALWRRVQEGDLDHVRVLVEAFLSVAERVLPQQFLEQITSRNVRAKHPGSW